MKIHYTLMSIVFCACAGPVNEQITNDTINDSEVETDTNSDNVDSNDDETTVENSVDESISENERKENDTTLVLESSIWYVTDAVLIEDTCEWDPLLRQFFGIGSDALLPSDFTVEGLEGSFFIEANDYGANGPISCELNELNFTCQTQTVIPLDFDLGTYGWTYAIDFSGYAIDENSISGTAQVSFPTISDWLIPIFQSSGIDASQCSQSFDLSISID